MAQSAIIFGGAGYIGTKWAECLVRGGWGHVLLADIRVPSNVLPQGVVFKRCDVRRPIIEQIGSYGCDWMFNFAAIHREPGHSFREYFDTNLPGARNVCDYADRVGCGNVFFTSSIAVYGEIAAPTDEGVRTYPDTGYGISKLCAELIHETWQKADPGRRLIIVRPGVVYGPGDPGNILRMIRAIQKGIFVMPGDGQVRKSYAYIYGLLDSMEFMMSRAERYLCYNYVEKATDTLAELVASVTGELGIRRARVRVPTPVLVALARAAQLATGGRSPIHPVRVRKAAQSTHIIPGELLRLGFNFNYDFRKSLKHWMSVAPADFGREFDAKPKIGPAR